MNSSFYDISKLLLAAKEIDIAPSRAEWIRLLHSLKQLNYSENDFVNLSLPHGTAENVARRKWREEKRVTFVHSDEEAIACIAALCKEHGVDMARCRADICGYLRKHCGNHCGKQNTLKNSFLQLGLPNSAKFCHNLAKSILPPSPLTAEIVTKYSRPELISETGLWKFLCSLWPSERVAAVMGLFGVAAYPERDARGLYATTFPQTTAEGSVMDVKLWAVDSTSGSSKTTDGRRLYVGTLRSKLSLPPLPAEFRPNFGEMWAARTDDPIAIVESEKSALIGSLALPTYAWVAVASKSNLTPERCARYQGRDIVLFPDADGEQDWQQRAAALRREGHNVRINRFVVTHQREPHDDIADVICRNQAEAVFVQNVT